MFKVVKMTHVCRYWRSALISYPLLWSSIFVNNGRKDFVTLCLERSRKVPLTVPLDLRDCGYNDYYYGCTCTRDEQLSGLGVNDRSPCSYHTPTGPLLKIAHIRRIRTLDVRLDLSDGLAEDDQDEDFWHALDGFKLFAFPLPALERLSFYVNYDFGADALLELPKSLFSWRASPPTKLRHLTLHGCYGGPVRAVHNLTSFELAGIQDVFELTELDQRTFLPLISNSPSLVSLSLSHFGFPNRARLSGVTPVRLPKLKLLRLMYMSPFPGFPCLMDVPAFSTLSSLRISVRESTAGFSSTDFLVHAENDDGFQLSYHTLIHTAVVSDWLDLMDNAGPSPAFVCFEGRGPDPVEENEATASPLPFFVNAKALEVGAPFACRWYRNFWKVLRKVGPQLAILHLEVVEGMEPAVAKSVKKFFKARFNKSMPLEKLERMTFGGMSEEGEEKAKMLWEEFRAGLKIDQYLQ